LHTIRRVFDGEREHDRRSLVPGINILGPGRLRGGDAEQGPEHGISGAPTVEAE
jgi:hypothetical protein